LARCWGSLSLSLSLHLPQSFDVIVVEALSPPLKNLDNGNMIIAAQPVSFRIWLRKDGKSRKERKKERTKERHVNVSFALT
jgi:hypothetical protein